MRRFTGLSGFVVTFSIILSVLPLQRGVRAQDLVASESLSSGSSVFVFSQSRKKPQSRLAVGRIAIGAAARRVRAAGAANSQIAAVAAKRRATAIAARKKAVPAPDRRMALSRTLTIKAEGFLDNNQTDLAITNYRTALVQNPKNIRASEGLSNALTVKGVEVAGETNNPASIVYFEEAAKLDKQNDVAWAKLGAVYEAASQNEKAAGAYEKALAINPEYSLLYAPLGLSYIEAGEIAKAEQQLRRSDAAGIDDAETRLLRSLVFYKQNRNDEALAAVDKALELDSRFIEAQYYRGQILERLGRSDQEIAAYKGALSTDPTFTPARFDLGVAYYNAGDYNNAAVTYQDVLKSDPANAEAHANLASAYRQLDRCNDANREFALAANSVKTADLYSEWGYCLGKTNEWNGSVEKLNTAAEISPTAIDNSNMSWGYYNSGKAKSAANDEEGAKKDYERSRTASQKAIDQDPKLDAAYLNLGSTHNALGEFQQAVDVLTRALGLRGDWAIAMNQLGYGYRGLKDFKNAIAIFRRVVDSDGRNTFGLFNLGETYFASGNKKEAKKINDQLRRVDPSLASRLDNILSGKVVIDAAKQKIKQKVPIRIPRFP